MAVRCDENVHERNAVSGPTTGISCDCGPRGVPVFSRPSTSAKQGWVKSSILKKCGKEKPKRCKSLMRVRSQNESCQVGGWNDTRKEGVVKMGGNTKGSKQALVRVVWSQPSRRLYSIEIKD